jgi:hypothetical protein
MSVVKVENDRIYDEQGLPNLGGINDPRMGTMDKEMKCYTCKGSKYSALILIFVSYSICCLNSQSYSAGRLSRSLRAH